MQAVAIPMSISLGTTTQLFYSSEEIRREKVEFKNYKIPKKPQK